MILDPVVVLIYDSLSVGCVFIDTIYLAYIRNLMSRVSPGKGNTHLEPGVYNGIFLGFHQEKFHTLGDEDKRR